MLHHARPQMNRRVVRAAGIEPARLAAADFKSDASTNFAMPAPGRIVLRAARTVLVLEFSAKRPGCGGNRVPQMRDIAGRAPDPCGACERTGMTAPRTHAIRRTTAARASPAASAWTIRRPSNAWSCPTSRRPWPCTGRPPTPARLLALVLPDPARTAARPGAAWPCPCWYYGARTGSCSAASIPCANGRRPRTAPHRESVVSCANAGH